MKPSKKPKFRSITVTGYISSGSSTLARFLSQRLGWRMVSVGEEVRKLFKKRGWKLEDTEHMPPEIDREIEARMRKLMKNGKNLIYEAHLAGWNTRDLPYVLRVLLAADEKTQVERFKRREGASKKEALEMIKKRNRGLTRNFRKLYGIKNRYDPGYFHLILDTSKITPEEEADRVIEFLYSGE